VAIFNTLSKRFLADRSGTTAVLFGLSVLPVMAAVGSAVDYGRASAAQTGLQRAVDAAALALVKDAALDPDAKLKKRGEKIIRSLVRETGGFRLKDIDISRNAKTIRIAASGTMQTAFMAVAGFKAIPIGSEAESSWGSSKIELALVLDNTGSMNEAPGGKRKIDELKTAARDLLDTLRNVATDPDTVKVSIVPFDTEVRLEAKYNTAEWLRWSNPADRLAWTGYVIDRDQPNDASDAAPNKNDPKTLYPAVKQSQWKAMGDIAPIRPLTSVHGWNDFRALKDTIDAMRPRANTNVAIGVAWGLATLSTGEPFTEAAPFGTGNLKKFMIVLTDGENTQNHIDGKVNTNVGKIDARTRLACQAAKDAVTVYTIRLVSGNAGLLRECASETKKYFDVQDASQLGPVFQAIAREISATRLTM
jgi:uncharacterized protein YegL